MPLLDALTLVPTDDGYDFVLEGETLGSCDLDGTRLTHFAVAVDQRRRGIGSRAMALLLETFPSEARLEIEILAGDQGAEAFLRTIGFGVKAVVYDRRAQLSEETVELFRPVGQKELDLIEVAGMKAFPPRLPDQPIFYPVTTIEYARLIAADWNVRDASSGNVGHVLRFSVLKDFLDRHTPREAGGKDLIEHWIPAEELPALNAAIVGPIERLETWPP